MEPRVVMGVVWCLLGTSPLVWAAGGKTSNETRETGQTVQAGKAGTSAGRRRRVATAQRAALGSEALDKLRALLADADQETVLTATRALADSGAPNAAMPLLELLAVGAPPAAAIGAVDALRTLRDPASVEVLALYTGNRNVDLRRHAVQALGVFADARVVPVLLDRLGDAAPDVRAAAAEALTTRKEKAAVPRMMALMKRNDPGVAVPLGALAPVSDVPAIAELQGSIDDDNLATALGELLQRPDMPESVRVDIIKTLARVPGAAAATALIEYLGGLPANDRRGSRAAAQKAIDQRDNQR